MIVMLGPRVLCGCFRPKGLARKVWKREGGEGEIGKGTCISDSLVKTVVVNI